MEMVNSIDTYHETRSSASVAVSLDWESNPVEEELEVMTKFSEEHFAKQNYSEEYDRTDAPFIDRSLAVI